MRARRSRRKATILVADDEALVRNLVRLVLEQAGHKVLEASSGEKALEVAAAHKGTIHLLLTDVEMRRLDGVGLSRQLSASRPGLRTIYMSASLDSPEEWARMLGSTADVRLLDKPFSPSVLLDTVREALG